MGTLVQFVRPCFGRVAQQGHPSWLVGVAGVFRDLLIAGENERAAALHNLPRKISQTQSAKFNTHGSPGGDQLVVGRDGFIFGDRFA